MKISIDLSQFESISESSEQILVGGFSATFSVGAAAFTGDTGDNNCSGGNCKIGCGNGQNINCNTVAGCGVQQ